MIHQSLAESKRPEDGLLHCSGDLVGSLRHTMLRMAGAPEKERDIVGEIVLETGTLWHKRVAELLVKSGTLFMQEVRMNQWLPEGWGGTADWIFWHPDYQAFVLGDLKTTAGEGLPHIEREGIKHEHLHQLSAYWHALAEAGLPLVKGFAVLYLPKNRAKNYKTEPLLVEAEPLSKKYMLQIMQDRRMLVDAYLGTMQDDLMTVSQRKSLDSHGAGYGLGDIYDTPELAEPMERVQKLVWNVNKWDLKLVPHWSAQFCPYDDELCDCSTQGETKIGVWEKNTYGDDYDSIVGPIRYKPRKGYEDIEPLQPTSAQARRLNVTSQ